MDLRESFRSALDGLNANRMRSFLSMLGIIIGIAAVVAIVAITQGSQQRIFENIQALGTNRINVTPGRRGGFAGRRAQEITDLFTIEEGELILRKASAVAKVAPVVSRSLLLQYKDKNVQVRVNGVTPEYQDVLNFWVEEGRFVNSQDLKTFRTVIVLGQKVCQDLFGEENPLGKNIVVNAPLSKYKFRVIGVMEAKGRVMFFNFDDQVFIPITTAQRRLFHTKYVDSFSIQAKDEKSTAKALEQIDALLYQKFQDETKYTITSQEELLSTMENITGIFTIMLAGIAGISLLVGGIGIMNIMLVSVTERTREIGIRMAVGAKRVDILLQFLWESVLLCLIGGAIGIAIGWIGSKMLAFIGSKVMPGVGALPTVTSPEAMLLALGFATAVGLFFGMYPANKASKLDPVEALRYE